MESELKNENQKSSMKFNEIFHFIDLNIEAGRDKMALGLHKEQSLQHKLSPDSSLVIW